MAQAQTSPLDTTFHGYIFDTVDALILFEACLSGVAFHVPRRPHDREREQLICSGAVFVYEEHSSGIKRWTDGFNWSPSRILNNFLIYRELEGPFPPGEKKRARKAPKSRVTPNTPSRTEPGRVAGALNDGENGQQGEAERHLIGSLVDSYPFKEAGLVKKTISITHNNVSHHLVSYYSCADVIENRLTRPKHHPKFRHIIPRPELFAQQNFRQPITEQHGMAQFPPDAAVAFEHPAMYSFHNQAQGPPRMYVPEAQMYAAGFAHSSLVPPPMIANPYVPNGDGSQFDAHGHPGAFEAQHGNGGHYEAPNGNYDPHDNGHYAAHPPNYDVVKLEGPNGGDGFGFEHYDHTPAAQASHANHHHHHHHQHPQQRSRASISVPNAGVTYADQMAAMGPSRRQSASAAYDHPGMSSMNEVMHQQPRIMSSNIMGGEHQLYGSTSRAQLTVPVAAFDHPDSDVAGIANFQFDNMNHDISNGMQDQGIQQHGIHPHAIHQNGVQQNGVQQNGGQQSSGQPHSA